MKHKSVSDNKNVEHIRYQLGFEMGLEENKIENKNNRAIVLSIPNTSIPAARGFADATNLDFEDYIEKRQNVNRTFILPTNEERIKACEGKFIYHEEKLKNQDIYIIDDSIIRGNTILTIMKKLLLIGVKKIHLRITAPPIISQCYYGIDIPTKGELIANGKSVNEIKKELNVTTLKYIDIKHMKKIFKEQVCTSCFTGKYNNKLLEW